MFITARARAQSNDGKLPRFVSQQVPIATEKTIRILLLRGLGRAHKILYVPDHGKKR